MSDLERATLSSLAKVIRSKNAGPFQVTVDLLFGSESAYERVRQSGVLTPEAVARAYRVGPADVLGVYFWDSALAVKITIAREVSAGAPGDNDCYGAQQHAPLLDFVVDPARRT
jgi:protein involved in polysaccharide export with SLBB domain